MILKDGDFSVSIFFLYYIFNFHFLNYLLSFLSQTKKNHCRDDKVQILELGWPQAHLACHQTIKIDPHLGHYPSKLE